MHISGKIGIPVGIVMLIIGGLIAASAFGSWEEAGNIETFMSEPSTEIVQQYIDEDGGGFSRLVLDDSRRILPR